MLKIAIVEDYEQTARDVQEMIQRYAQEHHLDTECRWFPDGEEIAAVYEEESGTGIRRWCSLS